MVITTHVRAELQQVLAVIDETLAEEGFRRSSKKLEPRVLPYGDETVTLPPEVPPNMRRVTVATKDGWVAIADDAFAQTEWGKKLSERLEGTPVFTLEGECDHAFYSRIRVHEGGAVVHRSDVPEDAVHEADGRHRIRPLFLAEYFPEAKDELAAGIVVNKLGGEENVDAVATAIGIPNALLSSYDGEADGRVWHLFEYDPTLAGSSAESDRADPMRSALETMMQLAGEMSSEGLAALGFSDPKAMATAILEGLMSGAAEKRPLCLQAPSSGRWVGFVDQPFHEHMTFCLSGGEGERVRGVTIRVRGSGLEHIDLTKISIMPASSIGAPDAPRWEIVPEREGDDLVARVPDIELASPSPDPEADALPPAERLRRNMNGPRMGRLSGESEIVVYLEGKLLREGKGAVEICAETWAADGQSLTATSENSIDVKPALRVPVLPEWVDEAQLQHHQHDLAAYGARDAAMGWLAFDRPWADVKDVVCRMAVDLGALLLEILRSEPKRERVELPGNANQSDLLAALERGADVVVTGTHPMRATLDEDDDCVTFSPLEPEPPQDFVARLLLKGGEHIEFPAPVNVADGDPTWQKILAELERGADVTLEAGPWQNPTRIAISHQPEGSNHFPDPARAHEHARVQLTWHCPRPSAEASRRSLGMMATDLLRRAGHVERNLGGVALAGANAISVGSFETPYESLVGSRFKVCDPKWLASHARSPGHRVLVPAKVEVGKTPGVEQDKLAHGTLLSSAGDDPFTWDPEPMERAIVPLIGTREEIAHEAR